MIDWMARAKVEILQSRPTPTDRTDETPISSVSSVALVPVSKKLGLVSSVSSVGSQGFSKKHTLRLVINRACNARGDEAANRQLLLNEAEALNDEQVSDLIEHFEEVEISWKGATGTDRTDETPDDRRLCAECHHGRSRRCPDGEPLPRDIPHRCPHFTPGKGAKA